MSPRISWTERARGGLLQSAVVALIVLALVAQAEAQLPSPPRNTQCSQWDDAYLKVFEAALALTAGGTLVLGLCAGLFGRFLWILAAPRLRIVVVAALTLAAAELGVVALPWTIGFGWLWFSAVDSRYFECLPLSFGAKGLLGGWIGSGVAAVAQWPAMTYLLGGSAIISALLGLAITETLARLFGLRRRASEEAT